MEKKYIVVDETRDGDSWTDVYETAEEANQAAWYDWNHLTKSEQKGRHIYAAVVTHDDLADDAFDEDTGTIDWCCWAQNNPCGFDSEEN